MSTLAGHATGSDAGTFSSGTHIAGTRADARGAIRIWLYVVLALLVALVLVGGATRLTDSGLSITEWEPISGVLPPLTQAQWDVEFAKYREIPEYQLVNRGMSLDEFKVIYWWEWGHRFLARGIGLAFALPLAFFWLTKRLDKGLKFKLTALLALGAAQGAVGWWMVSSGLTERTDVSQYRLAVHLVLASLIVAAVTWVAVSLRDVAVRRDGTGLLASRFDRAIAGALAAAVMLQIYFGALVAGLDAGMAWNTWPLMEGEVVPPGLLAAEPAWRNFFENAKTVQFVHRSFAFVVVGLALWSVFLTWRSGQKTAATAIFALVAWQTLLGVGTLIAGVPLPYALLHQGSAIILLIAVVAAWRSMSPPLPRIGSARAKAV